MDMTMRPRLIPKGYIRKRIIEASHNSSSSWSCLSINKFMTESSFNAKVTVFVACLVVFILSYRYYNKLRIEKKKDRKRQKLLRKKQKRQVQLEQFRESYKEALIPESSRGRDESQDEIWAGRGSGFFKDPTPASESSGYTALWEAHQRGRDSEGYHQ